MPRPRKKPSAPGEGPNEQQKRHAVYLRPEWQAGVDRHVINLTENKLRELEYLGVLSARQREAGELYEADYWLVIPGAHQGDSSQPRIGGEAHETDAQVRRVRRAAARVKAVKSAAGTLYPTLREIAVFRQMVRQAAMHLPGLLDLVGDVYELPRK